VSRYQKIKTNLDFTEARDSEWQWNPLGHMQVCTSLQTDNHASTPPLGFFTGRMPFLPPNQQCQSTEGKTITITAKPVSDSERQWHQLGHMQVCTLLQADNHANSSTLSFLQAGCPSCCPTNQQRQSTEGRYIITQ